MSGRKVVKPASGVAGVFRERLEKTAKGEQGGGGRIGGEKMEQNKAAASGGGGSGSGGRARK